MKFTPYQFQSDAINAIFNYFYKGGKGNPLVVAPTGSGKSVIIACFCEIVRNRWPSQKILVISHVKEILVQNYSAIKKQCENSEIGLYSAGLKSKSIKDITIAGVQSIYNKPELFDQFNIIIADEAHTIPHGKNGRYHKFFAQVQKKVIGFTATPFRLGYGYLHLGKDKFFDEIVYSIPLKMLQEKGFLAHLSAKGTKKRLDPEGIKKVGGDFALKELSIAFDREAITADIITELLTYKELRKKWLVFAIDIEHAEHITNQLVENGIKAAVVHSRMDGVRADVIADFKNGEYQALVSVAVLTTGFDAPDVDLIALLRPTSSPVLHIQIIGRGLRIAPGKKDCLVLDFAGNLLRNGPIDAPVIKLKGKGGGEAIMKECPNCWEIVHAAVRICPSCNQAFKFRHKLSSEAASKAVVSLEEWHDVEDVKYTRFVGVKKTPMMKVMYLCGLRSFNEYVCLQHTGYARYKAEHWWSRRCKEFKPPLTATEAVEKCSSLKKPKRILVEESGRYPNMKEMEF